jgi:hypothetical protein
MKLYMIFLLSFLTMLTTHTGIVVYSSTSSPTLTRFVSGNDIDDFYSSDHFWSFENVVPSYNIARIVG